MTTVPPINLSLPNDCDDCIDMGLTVGPLMNVTRVYPRTVGERLGMLVGDRIIEFNGMAIKSSAQYRQLEKNVRVGDQVELIVDRGTQRIRIVDVVPDLTKKTKRDRWGGGPFSQRRFGFSKTTVHDSVISPNECGGPLVNLKGQFCGINIARSMRVASMTIPASTVRDFLLRYMDISQLEIQR
jgi:serine protease Do